MTRSHSCKIEAINYGKFSEKINEMSVQNRIPLTGSIELTHRCNLSCKHCYVNLAAHDPKAMKNELSTSQWYEILDDISENGCLWLLISGGEPLLRPDFKKIFLHAKRRGLLITVFTNGTLLTESIASFFSEHKPFSVGITLYGSSTATYKAVTGSANALKAAHKAIELLFKYNVPLDVRATLSTINAHELDRIKDWTEKREIHFKYEMYLNPRIDGGVLPLNFRLSPEKAVSLDMKDKKRLQQWKKIFSAGPDRTETKYIYPCGAGINGFHIDPYGKLSLCMMVREPAFSLVGGGFAHGWKNVLFQARMKQRTKTMECDSCKIHSLCDQCPGWAEIEKKDPESIVSHLCQVAHFRYNILVDKTKRRKNEEKEEIHLP